MRLESRSRPSTNGSSSANGNASPSHHTNSSARSEANGFRANGVENGAQDRAPFFGHDREEVTRIILQSLSDLGYQGAAQQLSRESGYELEIPSVAAFRNAVMVGEWEEAERLLLGAQGSSAGGDDSSHGGGTGEVDGGVSLGNGANISSPIRRRRERLSVGSPSSANGFGRQSNGLPLVEDADTGMLKFLLRQQKYLELLEKRDSRSALSVLRNELTPLKRDTARLHALSALMMCPDSETLRLRAAWDGAEGDSRGLVLSEISRSISPSAMIPEHRLATLLTSVQQEQIGNCRYHNTVVEPSLYTDHECHADDFPLHDIIDLRNHVDEIWHIEFSPDGSMLATAGKDGLVTVYDTSSWSIVYEFREPDRGSSLGSSAHADNKGICYVSFSPNSQYLISCSQANEFVVYSVSDGRRVAMADHFDYPVTTAAWLPDSQTFVVGTQGSRRPLGLYSLRSSGGSSGNGGIVRNNELHSWREPLWENGRSDNPPSFRVTDCTVSPTGELLVAATISNKLLVYDIQNRTKLAEWQMGDKITSVNFDSEGQEILINMNEGRVMALDAATGECVMSYDGAAQREFVIRSTFGGAGQGFVISGSEDSRVYIWRRQTGVQVAALDGHIQGTVNAVAWHPTNPAIFASCGDDRRVKIWASTRYVRGRL
ncbi:WD40 repeat-like protein [Polychaeton citri CBS 116435]|uniref:WD40 repeat-like protein n=1 Tax=Polychaeton citri CBS 116435 TaxID=1314669 RepID=A0A9P4Q134_9PEZI|nr:WD40 repeat-like protein [Polychaeton citri CBS 116435]